MNLRHNIDPVLVRKQVENKCSEYEHRRTICFKDAQEALEKWKVTPQFFSQKPDPEYIVPMYNDWIKREQDHYAQVRVIRIGRSKYILVYGDADDANVKEGTGPFKTLKRAKEWFLNGGR